MEGVYVFLREFGYGIGAALIGVGICKGAWYLAHNYIPFVSTKPTFGMHKNLELVYETPIFPYVFDKEERKEFFEKISRESRLKWWHTRTESAEKKGNQWEYLKNEIQKELDRLTKIQRSENGP
jgi:hypothetical protein